jgi:hypothetical protein
MPRGQTEHLKQHQYEVKGSSKLAKSPITVRLPEDIDAILRSIPDRNKLLQKIITEGVNEYVANSSSLDNDACTR